MLLVSYFINVEGEVVDLEQDFILLDCEYDGIIVFELYVYDGIGNSSFCFIYFLGIIQGSYFCEGNVFLIIVGVI